ncbi:Pirin-like protein CC_3178 [Rhodovastum atsumiense]|uniref:Pirin family protein n=1 Tax=Rhodovastum atsumiense TaxID=504468 RepID=A0A5M6IMJ7_9PROT|nr:pirin family protein [Rhodovastum atsumiense]KAA5609504.1 pirin family protein [Rhodovastum atsumiense]CAH2600793.1 Pirin-like protein CC_3178 [Rhodovastum atsumiense]
MDLRHNIPTSPSPEVETVIIPRAHDIGGFEVRRALPAQQRQMVGPFIFFDQMGPGEFLTGQGLDVRPHPHIGLSTVTYLFDGEILHRDSLGSAQPIRPGDVNWMTAGRGIAHSERTDPAARSHANRLFGIQSWVALPQVAEEREPDFAHHPAATLPLAEENGLRLRLIAGTGWGLTAPVATTSPLFYADAVLGSNAPVPLPDEHEERAAYIVQGALEVAGIRFESGRMLLFRAGDRLALRAGPEGARLLLLGGAAMDGPRFLFWNFVSSRHERIEQAKADWKAGRFAKVPGDEREFIALPEVR